MLKEAIKQGALRIAVAVIIVAAAVACADNAKGEEAAAQDAPAAVVTATHDDDSVICAAVNPRTNRARWFVGLYNEAGKQGTARYTFPDGEDGRWVWVGTKPVPALVKALARGTIVGTGKLGTQRVRAACRAA